jgi:hypothetical protein
MASYPQPFSRSKRRGEIDTCKYKRASDLTVNLFKPVPRSVAANTVHHSRERGCNTRFLCPSDTKSPLLKRSEGRLLPEAAYIRTATRSLPIGHQLPRQQSPTPRNGAKGIVLLRLHLHKHSGNPPNDCWYLQSILQQLCCSSLQACWCHLPHHAMSIARAVWLRLPSHWMTSRISEPMHSGKLSWKQI